MDLVDRVVLVKGDLQLPAQSHSVMLARSYVWPSVITTGSGNIVIDNVFKPPFVLVQSMTRIRYLKSKEHIECSESS